MKKWILCIIMIAGVCLSGVVFAQERRGMDESLKEWIDQKLAEWKPTKYKPMMFTVVDWPLQSVLAKNGNMVLDDMFLDAMLELNPDAVYLSILPQAYTAYKPRYDHAIQRIKEKNKILIISYNIAGNQERDPTFPAPPTVEEYIAKEKQYTDYYVGNYKPDYFLVVVEISTENKRMGNNWDADVWGKIISETSEYAKKVNPNVKVGAILTIVDFDVFERIKNMGSLDVIGFNIYGKYRIYDEYRDAKYTGDCVGQRIREVNIAGKESWIFETWATNFPGDPTFNQDWRAEFDSKWIRVMTYYAQKHGAKNVMPFFTAKYIVEGSFFDFTNLESELKNGKRTPLFSSFKVLIQEFKTQQSSKP